MTNFLAYGRRLRALLQRRGRSPDDTDDLIQEAYLRMQVYLNKGRMVREPEAFLVRTALRLHSNAQRYDKRHPREDRSAEDLELLDMSPSPYAILEAEDCLRNMREKLDAANVRTREIFFMHRLDEMSYAQIAIQVGISVSAVEKHVARAVAILMEHVSLP